MPNTSSSNKSHSKRSSSSRDRERNKFVASTESGASSQCDTPPLNEKEVSTLQGRYAGVSPESVQCMAEQAGAELTGEAVSNLAEDVSYKLRQVINSIALHSQLMKKTRVEAWDVNSVLKLMDTGPVVGPGQPNWLTFGEDKMCCVAEHFVNLSESALTTQTCSLYTLPSVSVEWIMDEKSLVNGSSISFPLQNYYTKISRAILNLKRKLKDIAVDDLATNTRIGPILPNLFNLAVLVLNDDNLNALNVPAKKPLQSNVLDMVDALCSNPCSLDTNIQQQFQRLFPVMVSNILGNGPLAEKMVAILTKITRTWPPFVNIGKGILSDYLSQGSKERLTGPMIKCLMALGRQALVESLAAHLDYIDECIHAPRRITLHAGLREAMLDVSTYLLRAEPTTFLEDFVTTDYTLYEMVGDSVLPRRLWIVKQDLDKEVAESETNEKKQDEDFPYKPLRPVKRRPRARFVPHAKRPREHLHRDLVFKPVSLRCRTLNTSIRFKVTGCRTLTVRPRQAVPVNLCASAVNLNSYPSISTGKVVAATGLLNRFRYKLPKTNVFPTFGLYSL